MTRIILITAIIVLGAMTVFAQTTAFTYQGSLNSGPNVATGNHDFEFLLFDGGGVQLGQTITQNGVLVTNGIFAVSLDFGNVFPGTARFLEIHVKTSGVGVFTTLSPRLPLTSVPYSVKSLSADNAANAANATNSVNATNAATAGNFTGNLNGDVTGTQGATTVARLQGRNVANTAPLNDQVLKFNAAANQWLPGTDNTGGGGGGGTITGVAAGTGLTGGGASGNVTLSIANGGVGTTQLADSGVTDPKIASVSGSKVTGAVANATNATNATTAGNFTGNLSGDVTGTQALTTVSRLQSRNVASTAPLNGQVLKYNALTSQWEPDTDNTGTGGGGGTITGVTPGTGLTGGGATGTVTVGIANGGVGTTQLADNGVTDAKVNTVSGSKVTGTVANSTNAVTATNATTADTATNALSLGGVAANQYLQTNGNGSGLTNLNASNVAAGTLSNSRLGQIPTANIADSAVTSTKIASGQVVKSVNALTDNITLAAGPNVTITPAGNTLTIASTSGGVGGSGTAGFVPLWSNPTTLGTSAITQNGNGVQLPNGVQLAPGAQNNNVAFGSPSGETGMTIAGASGRADVRFGPSSIGGQTTLKLLAGPAGAPPGESSGIAINTAGNVGIGTAAPSLISGGSGRFASISDSTNPGLALTNTSARQFFMYSAGGSGSFRVFDATSNADRLTIDGAGNVGIGTTSPAHRLSILDGPNWTSNLWKGAIELGYGTAIGWRANPGGQRFGIGPGTGGLYFFRTLSDPGTTGSPTNFDLELTDTGNLVQPINNNGLVKAMVYVNANGTTARCYNGITNSSTGNCGFSTNRISQGDYFIDFGFQVNNRFYALTMLPTNALDYRIGNVFFRASANQLNISTTNGNYVDSNFMIIVY